jgi:hypothetical protein
MNYAKEAQHERALGDQGRTSSTARMQSANLRISTLKFEQKASLIPKEVLEGQQAALMSMMELKASARATADAVKLASKNKKTEEKEKKKTEEKEKKTAEKEKKTADAKKAREDKKAMSEASESSVTCLI